MENEQEVGLKKKKVVLYIATSVGDKWQNKVDCQWTELKNGEGFVVEEGKSE